MNVTLKQCASAIGAIGVIGGAAIYMGLDPTPALRADVIELAGEVTANRLMILRDRKDYLRREIWQQEDRVDDLKRRGRPAEAETKRLRENRLRLEEIERQIRAAGGE